MTTLAERVTLTLGGCWHGSFGEIPVEKGGSLDRSITLADNADGSLFVFVRGGCRTLTRRKIYREYRNTRRAKNCAATSAQGGAA